MKLFRSLILTLGLLAATSTSARALDYAIFLGWWDTDRADSSAGVGLKADFYFGDGPWAFELRGSVFPELGSDLEDLFDDTTVKVDVEAIPIDLGLSYSFGDHQQWFLGGGGTYVLLDTNLGNIDDEVGWYGALGYKGSNRKGGLGFFAEVIYRVIEGTIDISDEVDEVERVIEITEFQTPLDGFQANLGVIWRW